MQTDALKNIAALIAVADHHSLTQAAEALGCSKAYLSQQIKRLESLYQVQLFYRTTRQMRLTEVGETFVAECRQALKLVEQAEHQLLTSHSALSGKIRITSVGGVFGEKYIAPAILGFMHEHPDIAVELDFSSKHHDLLASEYDLAIRMGPLDDSTLVAKQLCSYRPTLVASPAYVAAEGRPTHPKQLCNHKIISGSITHWQFQKGDEREDVKVTSHLNSANGHVMLAACEAGLGVARLPSLYVEDAIKQGRLVALMTPWHRQVHPCHVVYPPSRYRLQRVKALVEWLEAAVQKSIHDGA